MRGVDVPVTDVGSFVVVETEVRAQLHFLEPIKIQPEIDWRVVSRIAPDDDEHIDFTGIDVAHKFAQ